MILLFIVSALNLLTRYYLRLNPIYLNLILMSIFLIKRNAHLSLTFMISTSLLVIFEISLNFKRLEDNFYQITNITYFAKYSNTKIESIDGFGKKYKFIFKNIENKYKIGDIVKIQNNKMQLIKKPLLVNIREKYNKLINRFLNSISTKYSHFSKAILTNNKSDITKYESNLFQKAGISHILVVSGLHFYLIYIIFYYLLLIIKNEKLKYLILSTILLNYLILTGFSPSTLRAFIMIKTLIIYKSTYGKINLLSTLAISFIINAIILPHTLNSIGFKLSYLAVLGISISLALNQRYNLNKLIYPIFTTLMIQVSTAPIFYVNDLNLQPISILSNLIVTPLMLVFLIITILSLGSYIINAHLFLLLDLMNTYIFKAIKETAIIFSKFPVIQNYNVKIFLVLSILTILYIIYKLEQEKRYLNKNIKHQ
ncbi:ComEC/Rec2 family competence protein [Borrelia turicatae]|uniref:Competence protein n=2 Tax=Borrelia turicatae TaxID=142 RepID=A0A172XBL1_BORTU|nr:ComEC/Rec2 family competence protein [Borrelia turicatae]AAX17914.1 COME operon protein 3 [Borrelia turicatae 91E135]ANF34051.1 competence protein [Borrelia turicatae]UPA13422.1 ComEC/Rec2 family competence protein [Borrelia turicatae 91E135]UPA14906.1 ComEC/Rec2 family competence protein [Borrelia turicatae]